MEFPAYPKKQRSQMSKDMHWQEIGQKNRKPEIRISIVNCDENVYSQLLQILKKIRRRQRRNADGRQIEFCIEYAEYFQKTVTLEEPTTR